MSEKARAIVTSNMEALVDDLDRNFIRDMQKRMHLCSAKCCDDKGASPQEVQRCFAECSGDTRRAEAIIRNEMMKFQDRLQRCVRECQDRTEDKVTKDISEKMATLYQAEFEGCALKCVDEHVKILPQFKKRIIDSLPKSS